MNCEIGNKAMANVLLLYFHILTEKGITNDQTVYLDEQEFDPEKFIDVVVSDSASVDIDESFLREGAIIFWLCELNDVVGEYDDSFHDRGPRHVRSTTHSGIHQQVAHQSGRNRSGARCASGAPHRRAGLRIATGAAGASQGNGRGAGASPRAEPSDRGSPGRDESTEGAPRRLEQSPNAGPVSPPTHCKTAPDDRSSMATRLLPRASC